MLQPAMLRCLGALHCCNWKLHMTRRNNDRLPQAAASLIALVLITLATMLAATPPASAQMCSTDAQCGPSAGGYNTCLGDTLIVKRRLCVAGRCVEQEISRISCGSGGLSGTCQGNVYIRSGGRCDALSGRCTAGSPIAMTCVKSCSCRGNRLTVSTGVCSPGSGCGRAVFRCRKGCTCQPEPRCLEDPSPALNKQR